MQHLLRDERARPAAKQPDRQQHVFRRPSGSRHGGRLVDAVEQKRRCARGPVQQRYGEWKIPGGGEGPQQSDEQTRKADRDVTFP